MKRFFGVVLSEPIEFPIGVVGALSQLLGREPSGTVGLHREPGALLAAASDAPSPILPLTNESGRLRGVGAGSILNADRIRRRLIGDGHLFHSHCDLEIPVHLTESGSFDWELGLEGGFAFAVWDAHAKRLHLARDRFGFEPLYWCGDEEGVAFASSMGLLREGLPALGSSGLSDRLPGSLGRLSRSEGWRLDPGGLRWCLETLAVPPPHTLHRGVIALPAAGRLRWEPSKPPTHERWWTPSYGPKRSISTAHAMEVFEEAFRESVRKRLSGNRKAAVLLSGGLDSGMAAAEAASQLGETLTTVSFGREGERNPHLAIAREIARAWNTDHREILLSTPGLDDLTGMVGAMSLPLCDASAVQTWSMLRVLNGEPEVLLSGAGGDAVWGGDRRFAMHNLGRLLPRSEAGSTPHDFRKGRLSGLGDCWRTVRQSARNLHRSWRSLDPAGDFWNRWLLPDFHHAGVDFPDPGSQPNSHDEMLARDLLLHLPSTLLPKLHDFGAACSVEFRLPWLDAKLFETTARFPRGSKVDGGRTRRLLRLCASVPARRLPEAAIRERGRRGSPRAVPRLREDFNEVFREVVLDSNSRIGGIMEPKTIRRYHEAHRARDPRLGRPLWALLILELWMRETRLSP